jgi:hypothetical protein
LDSLEVKLHEEVEPELNLIMKQMEENAETIPDSNLDMAQNLQETSINLKARVHVAMNSLFNPILMKGKSIPEMEDLVDQLSSFKFHEFSPDFLNNMKKEANSSVPCCY